MPVRIRLMRMGAKKRPFYRIVVANSTSKRGGRSIDQIGYYDPLTDPATVKVDADKAVLWLQRGAQPTETTEALLKREGVMDRFQAAKSGGAAPPPAAPAPEEAPAEAAPKPRARSRKAAATEA